MPAPPTWKEHLKTLRQKEHDPPPKKGVAARMRSAPTGKVLRGSKQEPTPLPASQPELGTDRIVRFVTKQAPAPQALNFLGGAREGEEGRVLY